MLIAGLEKFNSGELIFDGYNFKNLNEDELSDIRRKNIGIIFQSFFLLPNFTALENVNLTLEINNINNGLNKSKEILDKVGLKHRFNHYPSQLSGGEQQRVAIARSLVMKPKLILADEPTGNLDKINSSLISGILFDIVKDSGSSLILVTHDLPMALEICDRSIILNNGEITTDMKTYEILKDKKIMEENRLELPYGFALHHLEE